MGSAFVQSNELWGLDSTGIFTNYAFMPTGWMFSWIELYFIC